MGQVMEAIYEGKVFYLVIGSVVVNVMDMEFRGYGAIVELPDCAVQALAIPLEVEAALPVSRAIEGLLAVVENNDFHVRHCITPIDRKGNC